MTFDSNKTEFNSEIHEMVYALGRRIVPFEISTAEISDKDMLEGLRQVYDFTVELFSDMYADPKKYRLTDGVLAGDFHQYLFNIGRRQARVVNNNWAVEASDVDILGPLAPMGIYYESKNGSTTIKSSKYPLFLKCFYMCCKASEKRKVNCWEYIVFCDFRIFNKRISLKLEDLTRALSDRDKAFVLELHDHLASKGIKPTPRKYYNRILYHKKYCLLKIDIFGSIPVEFGVCLGSSPNDEAFKFIVQEIEKLPNKEELLTYIVDNVNYCSYCCSRKGDKSCGGYWAELLGERRFFCPWFALTKRGKKNPSKVYNDHEINILKQFLDLRIKAIDSAAR